MCAIKNPAAMSGVSSSCLGSIIYNGNKKMFHQLFDVATKCSRLRIVQKCFHTPNLLTQSIGSHSNYKINPTKWRLERALLSSERVRTGKAPITCQYGSQPIYQLATRSYFIINIWLTFFSHNFFGACTSAGYEFTYHFFSLSSFSSNSA